MNNISTNKQIYIYEYKDPNRHSICNQPHQHLLTLDESIHYAYTHRTKLQKQENTARFYTKQHEYSKYNLLPNAQAEVGHHFRKDNKYYSSTEGYIDHESYQLENLSLLSSLTLFDGLSSIYNIKQKKLLIDKSVSDTKAIQNTIKIEVIQAYFQTLMTKENTEVIRNSLRSTKQAVA